MKKPMLFIAIAACAAVIAGAAGCVGMSPRITYKTAQITDINVEGASVNFLFEVRNPNIFGISNALVDYQLLVQDTRVIEKDNVSFNVGANGTTEVIIPADVNYMDVYKSAQAIINSLLAGEKSVQYTLNTTFHMSALFFNWDTPVTVKGEIPLPEVKTENIEKAFLRWSGR